MIFEYYDFGVDVDVSAPPADDVFDFSRAPRRHAGHRRARGDPRHLIDRVANPAGSLAACRMEPVSPSIGWGVLHLFFRVDRPGPSRSPARRSGSSTRSRRSKPTATRRWCSRCSATRPTSGSWRYGPDLARLHAFQQELLAGPLLPDYSFVSLTELSEYSVTEDDERARLADGRGASPTRPRSRSGSRCGGSASRTTARTASTRSLPQRRLLVLLPDVEAARGRRQLVPAAVRARKELMAGHARVGRSYAGRVLQLITGSVGLDDWEWGVTLLADDPVVLKEIVNEMRFDEVTARYGEFGPFFTGLVPRPGRRRCAAEWAVR